MDASLDKKAICREMEELLNYLQYTFRNRMHCRLYQNEKSGLYEGIEFVDDLYEYVTTISTSILKSPNGSINDSYEKRLVEDMSMIEEGEWIKTIFYYIMQLQNEEKHFIIATYFAEQSPKEIMKTLRIKERSYRMLKTRSLFYLGLLIPGGIRIER